MPLYDPDSLSALLERALAVPPRARAAFLDEACEGDEGLHEELSSLLVAHDEGSGFFERLASQVVSPALLSLTDSSGVDFKAGQTVAQYRLLEKLGGGGMGVVFKALDQRLDRFVALKFLPAHSSTDPAARERLVAEAKAASALDHPNIGVVHDIGETTAGRVFIVMGYYEGETLERKIQRGNVTVQQAFDLSRQLASALVAAHQKGIIHRDVKPSNVLITSDGTAKLLDFGIAKLADSTPTREGAAAGTVAYMSPEQTWGSTVDHRTDLWSLGVVLYEMLTGVRPFRADNDAALISAIRYDEWEPVDRLNRDVPIGATRILERCLAKDLDRRYGHARQLVADLGALRSGQPPPSLMASARGRRWTLLKYGSAAALLSVIAAVGTLKLQRRPSADSRLQGTEAVISQRNRLAVLPLSIVTSDPEDSYLADGVTDELIGQLSRIGGLRVIAHASVIRYKGSSESAMVIGRALAVGAILEGSVRKAADQVQVALRLVDTTSEDQLWMQSYTTDVSDLQITQREIALRVAEVLRVPPQGPEQRQQSKVGTSNSGAYLLYLKGRRFLEKRNDASVRQAKEYFEQALDVDPAFAQAWTGLADADAVLSSLATFRAADVYPRIRAAAERALQLDPELPEAHLSLAFAHFYYYWDFEAAGRHYRRAIELNPSYAFARKGYAESLRFQGRFDEALAEARQAVELDPLTPNNQLEAATDLYWARRYDESMAELRSILDANPHFTYAHFFRALVHVQKHEYEKALAALDEPDAGGSVQRETLRGYILAITGRQREAREGLDRLKRLWREQNISPFHLAVIHIGLGEHDQALDLLEQAYRDHDWEVRMLPNEPLLDSLRSHPRFRALADKFRENKISQ